MRILQDCICGLAEKKYARKKASDRSEIHPKNLLIILPSQFNYHTLPVTPFKFRKRI